VGCNACACYHFFDHLDLLWGYFFCHNNKSPLHYIVFSRESSVPGGHVCMANRRLPAGSNAP
ncbi:hypothetical protein, partial [uncultured Clostridium sp.]|uniref:hypothetical protein n=1 Tax=uncultured Clostridium sp. TaxID=59620 RepID=UPI0025D9BD8F